MLIFYAIFKTGVENFAFFFYNLILIGGTSMKIDSRCFDVFAALLHAVDVGIMIHRSDAADKEFPLQNFCKAAFDADASLMIQQNSRNGFPDFLMEFCPEAYEIKGLEFPGRNATFDANSDMPQAISDGRELFYVFGRYSSKDSSGNALVDFPLYDLVICPGSLFSIVGCNYENSSLKDYGSYGDMMIRNRQMFVPPTPWKIVEGLEGKMSLIVPEDHALEEGDPHYEEFVKISEVNRVETKELVSSYNVDLINNTITENHVPNPTAGKKHKFLIYCKK